jgi:hypothetical protein
MNSVKSFPYHPLVPMSLPVIQILNTLSLGLVSEASTKAVEGIGFKFYNNKKTIKIYTLHFQFSSDLLNFASHAMKPLNIIMYLLRINIISKNACSFLFLCI